MNKKQLIATMVANGHFGTKVAAESCLNDVLSTIETQVASGSYVRLAGFGKFENYKRLNGANVPKFRPFNALKAKVS